MSDTPSNAWSTVYSLFKELFGSLEKLLRYIAPGVLFGLLYKLARLPSLSTEQLSFGFCVTVPFIGMGLYSLHRSIFRIYDYILYFIPFRWKAASHIADLFLRTNSSENPLQGYIYNMWAGLHLALITGELLIFFGWFFPATTNSFLKVHNEEIKKVGAILFILTIIGYSLMHWIQYKMIFPDRQKETDN